MLKKKYNFNNCYQNLSVIRPGSTISYIRFSETVIIGRAFLNNYVRSFDVTTTVTLSVACALEKSVSTTILHYWTRLPSDSPIDAPTSAAAANAVCCFIRFMIVRVSAICQCPSARVVIYSTVY